MHPADPARPVPALRAPSPTPDDPLREPWAHAWQRGDGLLELQLAGPLPARWCLNLARGLASRGASLQTGFARCGEPGGWRAGLAIDAGRGAALGSHELLELTRRPQPPAPPPEPRILDFELGGSAGGARGWALEVHAWDAVGLLGAVLARVHGAGLAPVELILETEEECAFHRLELVAGGGAPPTGRQRRDLRLGLAALRGR